MSDAHAAMWRARLALIDRQRRFEWELAVADGHATGVLLARHHAHDLRNMIQVLELGLMALERRVGATDADTRELFDELKLAVGGGKVALEQVTGVAPARVSAPPGAIVGPAIERAVALVRPAVAPEFAIDARIDLGSATRTGCSAHELEEIIVRAVLDAVSERPDGGRLGVVARERRIDGRPWVELLCEHAVAPSAVETSAEAPPVAGSALAVIGLIVARVGGEVTVSPTRSGGVEIVVALPAG